MARVRVEHSQPPELQEAQCSPWQRQREEGRGRALEEGASRRDAGTAMREWVHPTTVMKLHAFDRPLDDLSQTIDDVEGQVQPMERAPTSK